MRQCKHVACMHGRAVESNCQSAHTTIGRVVGEPLGGQTEPALLGAEASDFIEIACDANAVSDSCSRCLLASKRTSTYAVASIAYLRVATARGRAGCIAPRERCGCRAAVSLLMYLHASKRFVMHCHGCYESSMKCQALSETRRRTRPPHLAVTYLPGPERAQEPARLWCGSRPWRCEAKSMV